jgi:O-antigen/teichoic acid export membrane protein
VVAGSLGRIIGAMTPLVLVPLMIRTWGLHLYGEWLILTAIPTYIMLAPDFGLGNAVVNQMAIATAEGRRHEAISLYRTSWILLTVMAACFALTAMGVSNLINWKPLGIALLSKRTAAGIISCSCVQIFLGQQIFLLSGVYRSARRNPRNSFLASLGTALHLVAGGTSLALGGNPMVFVTANMAARAAFLCVLLIDARRIMPDFTVGLNGVSVRAVRPYVVPGLGHAALPLINALQNEGMVLVVGMILGPVSVAVFQTTRTAVNGVKSLTGLVASAVGLEIPALVGEGRITAVRRLLIINTQAALAAAFGVLIVLGLFGEPIFRLWLRNHAVYSTRLVLIMVTSMFPFAGACSFALVISATNQIHRAVLMLLPAVLGSLVVAAVGCLLAGLNGAASGSVVYETLSLLAVCAVAGSHTKIQVRATLAAVFSIKTLGNTCQAALSTLRLAITGVS